MNDLQIFKNSQWGEIRSIYHDGEALFCGLDVAQALGYAKPQGAISRHCRHSLKQGVGVQTGTRPDGTAIIQQMEMLFIPIGDVYRLAARSKLEGAEKFESWIFDEVVPAVLRTGEYSITGNQPVAPPTAPLGAIVRLMEAKERNMKERGCDPYEIAAMMQGIMRAYNIPVTAAFSAKVDPQLSLFDAPSIVPQLPSTAIS